MMGERTVIQEALFYGFSLEGHVPAGHMLRAIDRFIDLSGIRAHLRQFYSATGRPSIDPELMIRTLMVGYCMGIRSERRLCEEVHLNLAYRWFCRLGLDGVVPDHSTFHEGARDMARDIATTDAYVTSRRQRKKVEMLFAHLKRILGLGRLRLRGPNGAKDEFHLPAPAQNLRKMAKLIPLTNRTAKA
jgi:hypothetical protein